VFGTFLTAQQPQNEYTYPLSLLTELPTIPEHFELARLRQNFAKHRVNVSFLASIPLELTRETIPPHLLLTMASFAAIFEHDPNRSRDLFLAAIRMWCTMSEIDNRETRTDEILLAVCVACMLLLQSSDCDQGVLLSVYGAVDSDLSVWRWTRMVLYGVATVSVQNDFDPRLTFQIARRRRLHECGLLDQKSSQRLHR
jgi:hypothetical protein